MFTLDGIWAKSLVKLPKTITGSSSYSLEDCLQRLKDNVPTDSWYHPFSITVTERSAKLCTIVFDRSYLGTGGWRATIMLAKSENGQVTHINVLLLTALAAFWLYYFFVGLIGIIFLDVIVAFFGMVVANTIIFTVGMLCFWCFAYLLFLSLLCVFHVIERNKLERNIREVLDCRVNY